MYSFSVVSTFHCDLAVQSNVEVTVKKPVFQFYNYSTVIRAAIRCKPYSEITVEIETQRKTVKIATNIFVVHVSQ